jgi:hypothetical protein
MDRRRVLLVAHRTASAPPIQAEVRHLLEAGPCSFLLLVPADEGDGLVWNEGKAWEESQARLAAAVETLRGLGADVEGKVGNHDPLAAVTDAVQDEHFDDIILSTFPVGISAWLGMDLPHRIERALGRKIKHVTWNPKEPVPLETHFDSNRPVHREA